MKAKLVSALALLGWATAAGAHHSFAMFDRTRTVTISGVIKEFQWTNPHTWIEVTVPGAGGRTAQWSIEGISISVLKRQGWNAETFKPGDRVTMTINPLKSGYTGGSFVQAKFADGHVVGGMAPPPPGSPPLGPPPGPPSTN